MKRKYFLIAIIGLCLLALPLIAWAEVIDSGECGTGIAWMIDDEGLLTITGTGYMTSCPWLDQYSDDIEEVNINNGVKNILEFAFYNTSIRKVTIPSSVTVIGKCAFYDDYYLSDISLTEGLKTIEDNAFYFCTSLKTIEIPDSVTSIGEETFAYCSNLVSVNLPNSLTRIKQNAFCNCKSLDNIIIPDSMTCIETWVFSGCSNLTRIDLPTSITSIEHGAFCHCVSLKSIIIPDGVTMIESCTFENCKQLSSVSLPGNLKEIGYAAFIRCSSLERIAIPESVTSIAGEAFSECTKLQDFTIPPNTTFGESALDKCYNLKSVTFSGYISSFSGINFVDCFELETINIPACNKEAIQWFENHGFEDALNISDHADIETMKAIEPTETETGLTEGKYCPHCKTTIISQKEIPALKDMKVWLLPSSLKTIDEEAFANLSCQAIIIPNGCKTIETHAFKGCTQLIYVQIPASLISIADDAFEECNADITLFRQK